MPRFNNGAHFFSLHPAVLRDLAVSVGPFIALALGLLALAYWWLDPNPPHKVRLATGPAQSAYEEFGKRYAQLLAKDGIEVVLVPSQGSSDNLRLLQEGQVDLGFVQGGAWIPMRSTPLAPVNWSPWAACLWNRCGCFIATLFRPSGPSPLSPNCRDCVSTLAPLAVVCPA